MAATFPPPDVEVLTSETDGRGRNGHEMDNQEFSDAAEHLPQSVADEEVQQLMPSSDQFDGNHDPDVYEQVPEAGLYEEDLGGVQGHPHHDGERYDMQNQMLDDSRFQGRETLGHHQSASYYQDDFDDASMQPEMTQAPSADPSRRAHAAVAEFQRLTGEDQGGKNRYTFSTMLADTS